MNYIERFMMHTELYMVLTGKQAQELTQEDMDRICRHINAIRQQEEQHTPAGVQKPASAQLYGQGLVLC